MALIEAKLWQEHGITGELIEVVEEFNGTVINHDESIEIILVVRQHHLAWLRCAEVITARLEGVPHHAVAAGAPIERRWRSHTAVNPVVGVDDGNALALV